MHGSTRFAANLPLEVAPGAIRVGGRDGTSSAGCSAGGSGDDAQAHLGLSQGRHSEPGDGLLLFLADHQGPL